MFRLKSGIDGGETLLRHIVHCLNSQQYLNVIDAQSTGSTKKPESLQSKAFSTVTRQYSKDGSGADDNWFPP